MKLHIFFNPGEIAATQASSDDIYIVIDVIRATTTLSVIFEQHAARVLVADTVEQARAARAVRPELLLCGERHARPLPGFDYGNSPAQFSQLDLRGRELVLTTTNGTRAFFSCPAQSTRLAGCFYNASAVLDLALKLAQARTCNLAIVCAAERGAFALDDSVCAGYLARELQRRREDIQLDDSVLAALALYQVYPPPDLIDFCNSAREVVNAGLSEDLDLCMRIDGGTAVPIVVGHDAATSLLMLERAH